MKHRRLSRKTNTRSPAKGREKQNSPDRNQRAALDPARFPVVGIGASAGGLEAFSELLDNLPANTGLAFVLVQHLAPKHASALTELLSRHSKLTTVEVRDEMAIEKEHVYVIPPDAAMAVNGGLLRLMPRPSDVPGTPIDFFLQSLAQDRQERAIGVILSGTGSDGTMGLQAIKAAGGVTFAQDEKTAKYDSMPHSAIASGAVDFILSPEGIAKELTRLGAHPELFLSGKEKEEAVLESESDLGKIFGLLRLRTGVDFSTYKLAGIRRRIRRRMLLLRIDTLPRYVQYVHANPGESEALYEDILIHVTSFFRDPSSFDALRKSLLPELLKNRDVDAPLRVWVAGCSTGEDAYSLLIVLFEYFTESGANFPIQAFATDVSGKAVARAREGIYPETIAAQVSPDRLRRYFVKTERGYRITKSIRDSIVFARHDITKDPPYSKLDLVLCRNLLMFLGPLAQRKVFGAIHYALKPTGYLLLGAAETVGESSNYFTLLDRKRRVYAKKPTPLIPPVDFASPVLDSEVVNGTPAFEGARPRPYDPTREADHIVIEKYGPAAVVINQALEVVQFRGHTGRYLDPLPGSATLNLLKIVRTDLLHDLRVAVQKVKKTSATVRKEDILVQFNGQNRSVSIEVIPLKPEGPGKGHCLILFEEPLGRVPPDTKAKPVTRGPKLSPEQVEIRRLGQELAAARDSLRGSLEDQEAVNEELRSATEETLSSNEELQTTNEELETAKEELQSTNEELTTLNEELQNRNQELQQSASDLKNVLSSAFSSVVVVDRSLRIRFFTPQAENVLRLIGGDIGRPLSDIKPALDIPDLMSSIEEVVQQGVRKDLHIAGGPDGWYSVRLQPYLAADQEAEGAVLVLTDVTALIRAQQDLLHSEEQYRSLVESVREYAIMMLDPEGKVVSVNPATERVLGYSPGEMAGKAYVEFQPAHEEEFRQELIVASSEGRYEAEAMRTRKDGTQFWANIVTVPLRDEDGKVKGYSRVIRDVSERHQSDELTRQLSKRLLLAQDEERERISLGLHDTAGPGLAALVMNLSRVQKSTGSLSQEARTALRESVTLAKQCAQELRTVSYQLHPPLLEESGLKSALRWYIQGISKFSGIRIKLDFPHGLKRLPKEMEVGIFRIVQEAVSNVERHSGGSTASVSLVMADGRLRVQVKDHGKGAGEKLREGLGIRSMRERVQLLGGQLAMSADGGGMTVEATLPMPAKEDRQP